jgi:hypothetical protein
MGVSIATIYGNAVSVQSDTSGLQIQASPLAKVTTLSNSPECSIDNCNTCKFDTMTYKPYCKVCADGYTMVSDGNCTERTP